MVPLFSIDWVARYAEETSQWANAFQLEAAMAEVFDQMMPVDLSDFAEDQGFTDRFVTPDIAHGVAL